jgi:hypothetical protein
VDDVLAFVVKVNDALFGGDVCLDRNDLATCATLVGGNVELLGSGVEHILTTAANDNSGAIDGESTSHALPDAYDESSFLTTHSPDPAPVTMQTCCQLNIPCRRTLPRTEKSSDVL